LTAFEVDLRFLVVRKVHLPPLPELPQWLQTLWLGWPGRAYGEDGLYRSALRKFARQLQNALSLASQVVVHAD
jgi:hypothetical protein